MKNKGYNYIVKVRGVTIGMGKSVSIPDYKYPELEQYRPNKFDNPAVQIDKRERFFKIMNIECNCLIGYVICNNCDSYYHDFDKFIDELKKKQMEEMKA